MRTKSLRKTYCGLMSAGLVLGAFQGVKSANAAAFLWIAAPTWSYSAAAAASPAGSIYFWALSRGANTWTWAAAYSNSAYGSGAAFAEAAAGRGGVGACQAAGYADPYAGVGIDTSLVDPSNPSGYPQSDPGSDPVSSSETVSDSGITFSGSGEELNGVDELEAFTYSGGTDETSLDDDFGAPSGGYGDSMSSGDVTDITTLESDFGADLVPLDGVDVDPGTITSLPFTENDSDVNTADVVLVAEGDAALTPEPTPLLLLAGGLLGLLARRRRRNTA